MTNVQKIDDFSWGVWSDLKLDESPKCRYCQNSLKYQRTVKQVKRVPPPGGKDLNLFDERIVEALVCTVCGGSDDSDALASCDKCYARTIYAHHALSAPDLPVLLVAFYDYQAGDRDFPGWSHRVRLCTNCLRCGLCSQGFNDGNIKILSQRSEGKDILGFSKERILFAFFHSRCALQVKEEVKRRQKHDLCIYCGERFGFFTKRSNDGKAHLECKSFKYNQR